MKKIVLAIMISFLMVGCTQNEKEKTALKIGDIEITASEFERDFERSSPSQTDSSAREAFLNNYISKKLLLKEAENLGLNKDPEFLLSIQIFWEQALLKNILSEKSQEFSSRVRVSEQEVKEYYDKFKNSSYANMPMQDVYDQITWILLKQKQSQAIQEWIESLEKKVKIEKNYKLLKIDKTE